MQAVRHSDAFLQLVAGNQGRLYGFILTLLPDPNEANEVLQQTNMALWHDAERFVEGTNFIAWAFRIARFMVLEHRERLRRSRLRYTDTLVDDLASEAVAFSELEESRLDAMRHCMERLADDHRNLLHRRYVEGESVAAIASSTGQTANALANCLYRIRRALLDCIQRRLAAEEFK